MYGYTQHPQGDHSDALLFWAGKSALRLNKKAEAELIWKKVALQFPGRYYGVRSLDLVSINIPITDTLQETGEIPASVRQFMLEQGYSEALVELEQSSGNIRVADIFAARRAIAAKAAENGNNALAIRALYPLFQYAEKEGYSLITQQDWQLYYPRPFNSVVMGTQKNIHGFQKPSFMR